MFRVLVGKLTCTANIYLSLAPRLLIPSCFLPFLVFCLFFSFVVIHHPSPDSTVGFGRLLHNRRPASWSHGGIYIWPYIL